MSASVASSVWWGLARSRSLSLAVASAARRCNGIQQQHARVARCCEAQSVIKGKHQLVARTAAAMYRQRVNIHNPDASVPQRSASHWQCSRCLPSTQCTSTRGMAVADVLDSPADNAKQLVSILQYKRAHNWAGTRWLPRQQQQASPVRSVPAACTPLVWGQRWSP
jgi:hypothetical protein